MVEWGLEVREVMSRLRMRARSCSWSSLAESTPSFELSPPAPPRSPAACAPCRSESPRCCVAAGFSGCSCCRVPGVCGYVGAQGVGWGGEGGGKGICKRGHGKASGGTSNDVCLYMYASICMPLYACLYMHASICNSAPACTVQLQARL